MREEEADLIDKLISKLKDQFGSVSFLEIGVFGGGTVTGVVKRCQEIDCPVFAAGVDFEQWKPSPVPLDNYAFFPTDSMDAWRDIKFLIEKVGDMGGKSNRAFNFLFVDGCHCVNHSMCDFLNYSPFVEVGGYCLFHDTAKPSFGEHQEAWPQDHSYAGKPPSVLGVREGLAKLGLLQGYRADWKLIEEITSDTGLMGMCLFRKEFEL